MGNKAQQSSKRSPGIANFAGFKETNVGLLQQRSSDFHFREIVPMFLSTVLIALSCHVLANMARGIEGKII